MTEEPPEDIAQLANALDHEPEYRYLRLETLEDPAELNGLSRYKVGDLVRVPRTGGHWSLGVLTEVREDQMIEVLVRAQDTHEISFKELDAEAFAKSNPLKIGDYVELDAAPFWVAGLDDDGEILVLSKTGHRVDPREFKERLMNKLEELGVGETVRMSAVDKDRLLGKKRTPTQPIPIARPMAESPYVPIEQILRATTSVGLIAGNRETATVYGLKSPFAGAALHTNKGHNYKSWNEDGGCLFADASGRMYLGVFDQAGGMGSDKTERGAASAIAAQALFDEMQAFAERNKKIEDAEDALVSAAQKAHEAILARGKREVTTYIGAMVEKNRALIVNIGDSGCMHIGADGKHLASTAAMGVGRILLMGLGMPTKETIEHHTYKWGVRDGEYLIFASDGLFDSNLSEDEIGGIVFEAGSAADATRRLRDVVTSRMMSKEGKPDNLTILIVRVGESPAA